MEYCQLSDKGLKRPNNEDYARIYDSADKCVRFYIVADGMGGHVAGDVASRMAAERFGISAKNFTYTNESDLRRFVNHMALVMDLELRTEAARRFESEGMGTTFVMYVQVPGYGLMCNIGDSRGYILHGGELKQITKDHSMIQSMMDRGVVFDDADRSKFVNRVTRAIGFLSDSDCNTFDIFKCSIEPGDVILLCSDGLTSMLSDDKISSILDTFKDPAKAAKALIDYANVNGGYDNITVSVMRCGAEDLI